MLNNSEISNKTSRFEQPIRISDLRSFSFRFLLRAPLSLSPRSSFFPSAVAELVFSDLISRIVRETNENFSVFGPSTLWFYCSAFTGDFIGNYLSSLKYFKPLSCRFLTGHCKILIYRAFRRL